MTRILITGGAGFIGVNAALHYAAKGFDVSILDNFSRRGTDINARTLQTHAPKAQILRGDIRNMEDLKKAMAPAPDIVLHLAGQVAVTTSVTDPRNDFDINAFGTFQVLEAVREYAKDAIVLFASTNKVYGGLEDIEVQEKGNRAVFADGRNGVTEAQQLDFHSPYGCSKGAADQYVRDYSRIYNMRTVVFRQSCIYGPHQMGMEDQGWVAWFMIAALFRRPITIYGNGKQVRDLLHVQDLLAAYDGALAHINSASGHAFNIGGGSGNTLSLSEFLEFLKNDLGFDLQPASAPERPGDQPIFVSDNTKAENILQWKPAISTHDGIRQLYNWLIANQSELQKLYDSAH